MHLGPSTPRPRRCSRWERLTRRRCGVSTLPVFPLLLRSNRNRLKSYGSVFVSASRSLRVTSTPANPRLRNGRQARSDRVAWRLSSLPSWKSTVWKHWLKCGLSESSRSGRQEPRPTHRNKAAMNGAQTYLFARIRGVAGSVRGLSAENLWRNSQVGGKNSRPTHRDEAAMNGAQTYPFAEFRRWLDQ